MYSPTVTRAAIDAAAARDRWTPEYHSASTRASAITYFDSLVDPDTGDLSRPLTAEETAYIANERRLCSLDFRHYCQYARIIDWQKKSVPFVPNVAQQIVLDLWGQLEDKALAISMQQLKARQLGVTTLTETAVAHRVQFHARTAAMVASATPEKTRIAAGMIAYNWQHQPWWLMPRATKVSQLMPVEFGDINTSLTLSAGNKFSGVGRGTTPNVAHLTEVAEWEHPEEHVDAALLRAMHETPDVFLVLESTAAGRGNWWHKTWKQSKQDWDLGRSRLYPLFLPWFVGTDIYPTPTWLRARPVPSDWVPKESTQRHAERARAYVLANPLLFQYLAHHDPHWQIPRHQLWFYEVERDAAIAKNVLNKFLSEMPADDQEAFQSTKVSAIASEVLLEYRNNIRDPVGVYAIIGDGIPEELTPSRRHWDLSRPVIPVTCSSLLPRCTDKYQFVPLEFRGYPDTEPSLRLFLFEWPEDDQEYGVGVDTSDGVGLDNSAINVVKKSTPHFRDAQVAEFASAYVKANQLWPMALAISTFFSVISPRNGQRMQARVAVECRGNGDIVQLEMKKRGWANFHPWLYYDNKKFPSPMRAVKEGVYTNQAFRAQMMDLALTLIDEYSLLIPSPYLVDEMESLERDETRQKLAAAYGEHDDRFMSLGFALFTLHVLDLPDRQFAKHTRHLLPMAEEGTGEGQLPYATWSSPQQGRDLPQRGRIPIHRRAPIYGQLGRGRRQQPGELGSYTSRPGGLDTAIGRLNRQRKFGR